MASRDRLYRADPAMIDLGLDLDPGHQTLASRAAALFEDYRAGDDRRMAELVALVTPILWHTARAQRLDANTAEDVVQTAWLALVRGAGAITESQAVLQWLIVSTRREAWRVARRGDRLRPAEFEDDDVVAPPAEAPEERVLRGDADSRLWEHIAALPERCRALLRVIAFADRPDYASVAEALGMPVGSIGPTRGRCLAKLRQHLAADPAWEG
jgi:RNA polymerase sigma factor (sigma-70 family)